MWFQQHSNFMDNRLLGSDLISLKYGALSDSLPVQHSVPTSNILGSYLFNIYINCLMESLQPDSFIAYADEITLVTHGASAAKAKKNMQSFCNQLMLG